MPLYFGYCGELEPRASTSLPELNKSAHIWLSDDLTIQVVAMGGGRGELRRSIGSKLHATQNDLALPSDGCYWPIPDALDRDSNVFGES